MKFSLTLLGLSILPLSAFANVSDTVYDIDNADVSVRHRIQDTSRRRISRTFYALEIGKKGQS